MRNIKTHVWFGIVGSIIGTLIYWAILSELPLISVGVCIGIVLGAYMQQWGDDNARN